MEPNIVVVELHLVLMSELCCPPVGALSHHPSWEPGLARANDFQLREAWPGASWSLVYELEIRDLPLAGSPWEKAPLLPAPPLSPAVMLPGLVVARIPSILLPCLSSWIVHDRPESVAPDADFTNVESPSPHDFGDDPLMSDVENATAARLAAVAEVYLRLVVPLKRLL